MNITVAKSAGFCFGVKRAIKTALKAAAAGHAVEMLGDIVHNEEVVGQIEASGIRKVDKLVSGRDKKLLIRAHGASKQTVEEARRLGYNIVDATCPMVKEIHKIAEEMEHKGYSIVVIGDRGHDEVHGIIGQLTYPALVIEDPDAIPLDSIAKTDRAAVVVQSTQSLENVEAILNNIRPLMRELRFHNTICKATQTRQDEIKTLPLQNGAVFIIGSKTSANTKRLYELSSSLNPRSYWIQSEADIRPEWLEGLTSVGVTAGASTPQETIENVVSYIKQFGTNHSEG